MGLTRGVSGMRDVGGGARSSAGGGLPADATGRSHSPLSNRKPLNQGDPTITEDRLKLEGKRKNGATYDA